MRVRTMGIAAVAASVALVIGAAVAMAVKTNADAQLSGYKEVPAISRVAMCSSPTSTSGGPPRTEA